MTSEIETSVSVSVTIQDFIRENELSLELSKAPKNPHMEGSAETMFNWGYAITKGKRHVTGYFSQGFGHKVPPTLADILDCLASDSSSIDETFEDWCADYGYDTDSRRAERIYEICKRQARDLEGLLGRVEYRRLLEEVERL